MKMKKRLFAIIMILAMVFTMMPIMDRQAYADDPHANFTPKYLAEIEIGAFQSVETGTIQFYPPTSSYYDYEIGNMILIDPAELKEVNGVIEISRPGQLVRLAESVNSGIDYTGKTIKLVNDISLQTPFNTDIIPTILEDTSDPITHGDFGITLSNRGYCKWPSPIGTDEHPFKGTFDGQGHSVTDMGVFNDGENTLYSGLFGVTENAVIKNVNITGHFVLANAAGEKQNSYAGALAGKCKNTIIENVHASCNIFNRALKGDAYAGGLVGVMADNSTAINSSSSGDIYNKCGERGDSIAGGLFGRATFDSSRKILAEKCFATGDVYTFSRQVKNAFVHAGGLVGSTGLCIINNCYAAGNVSAYHTDSSNGDCDQGPAAGGLIGNNNCDISNSYATGNVYSGTKTNGRASCCAGGLSGYIQNGTFTNCHTTTADGSESGRVIEVKTREDRQVRNFYYANWGIREHAKSEFSNGTAASLLNGEGGNIWTTDNGKTVLKDNPGYITPQDTWGTKTTENGAVYYVDSEGRTSTAVKAGETAWLKEKSGNESAWYGLDNSGNVFAEGSRFLVKRIRKEENPSEWEKYYTVLDEKYKDQTGKNKLRMFTCRVVMPDGVEYENLDTTVNLYVEIGEDWKQDEITGVFIINDTVEIIEVGSAERSGGPERAGTYAVFKINNFGPCAMIGKAPYAEITKQPKDLKLTYGAAAGNILRVAARAEEDCALSYQWYRKDSEDAEAVKLENETGKTYTVPTDKNVGTTKYYYCVVTATKTGSGAAANVTSDQAAVTINKAAVTIKADDKSSKQGEALKDLTYTVSGDYVKGDDLGVTLGTDANKNKAGTYDIKVSWNENPNYDARLVNGQYTVKRKAVPQPVLYRVSVSVQKEMEEWGTVEGGGTYTLGRKTTVKAVPNEGYHFKEWMEKGESVSTDAEYTFTVTKTRSLEAVFEPDEPVSIKLGSDGAKKVYTQGDELDVTGLFLELLKTGGVVETIPVTPDMVSGFDSSIVGTQTLTVSYEDFTDSYEIEILKKEPLPMEGVSANGYTGTYDGEKHSIEVSAPEGAEVTYSRTKDGTYGKKNPSYKNADTYTVYYRVKKAGYKTVTGSAKVKIKKAAITIKAVNKTSKRGEKLKKLTSKITGAYVKGDKLGIKLSTKAKKNRPGKYEITVRWNKNKNYKAKLVTGTYTVK